jgi:LEA14-like dessication related protein
MLKRLSLIISIIIFVAGVLFAYGRRYINKLSFDVDLELKIIDINKDTIVMPLNIFVDNKNNKSISINNLKIKIYNADNILLAQTYDGSNKYKIDALKINKFKHSFIFYNSENLENLIKFAVLNKKQDLYMVVSFDMFLIPITIKEDLNL